MKKIEPISIKKSDLIKGERATRRQLDLEDGLYSFPAHKVHKNKKTYTRKEKHPQKNDKD